MKSGPQNNRNVIASKFRYWSTIQCELSGVSAAVRELIRTRLRNLDSHWPVSHTIDDILNEPEEDDDELS